jgi:peptidoglycan/xylan/chitin deacetylase (PgdA/CDA1 family)
MSLKLQVPSPDRCMTKLRAQMHWHSDCTVRVHAPPATMARSVHTALVCSLLVGWSFAQTPALRVLPWNDHSAAVSLTFDDARPVQLDVAVPELNKRDLHATFFVIVSKLTRLDDWKRVQTEGHEIGNHSVSHEHPARLTAEGEESQVEDAKRFLDSNFKSNVIIFAYPYAELSPGLIFWVKKYDFAARAWHGNSESPYITSDDEPDWYNLPSQPVYTNYDAGVYKGWIDKVIAMQAWTILQMHGIGDPSTGFEPIPTDTFLALLDYLKAQESRGLWVAPFGTVAAYLRGQKILEAARPQLQNGEERFSWKVPDPFPSGVVLKVTIEGGTHVRVYQGERELHARKPGVYLVSFDSGELIVKGAL